MMKVQIQNTNFMRFLFSTLLLLLLLTLAVPASALSESEVETQVSAAGKETVTGSVLIWFLCAVAFLKVSQKIDSFMASLGVNVGHTGGSMLSEAMIAMRVISSAAGAAGRAVGGAKSGAAGSSGSGSGKTPAGSVFRGGLAGMVSRAVTNNAVRTATEAKSTTDSVQSDLAREAVYAAAHGGSGDAIHAARNAAQNTQNPPQASGGTVNAAPAGEPTAAPVTSQGVPESDAAASIPNGISENTPITTAETPAPGSIPAEAIGECVDAAPITMPDDPGISAPMIGTETSILSPLPDQEDSENSEHVVIPPASTSTAFGGSAASTGAVLPLVQEGTAPILSASTEGSDCPAANAVPTSSTAGTVNAMPAAGDASDTMLAATTENVSETTSAAVTNTSSQTVLTLGVALPTGTGGMSGGGAVGKQGGPGRHTASSKETASHSARASQTASGHSTYHTRSYGIGGAMFMKSLASGGSFANDIIGKVATGDIQTTGMISGDMASQAFPAYMGMNAINAPPASTPTYTDVEIGGGRITGIETAPGGGQSIQFAMYHTDQYTAPQGDYTKVVSADGATWYKQYAQDTVDRKPYNAPDNTVAYKETIVQRMPSPPRRKDKM